MKRIFAASTAMVLAACATFGPGDWDAMVDGERGLENWIQVGDANWRAEGGAIVADKGKGGFLVSRSMYGDFELRAEFWAETDTNSGIFFRCLDWHKITAATCYEANIWDIRPEPKFGTGAIVDYAAVPVPLWHKAGGKWNTLQIVARGSTLLVKFNGVVSARLDDPKLASGPFALQYGPGVKGVQGGAIKWRKVEIRRI